MIKVADTAKLYIAEILAFEYEAVQWNLLYKDSRTFDEIIKVKTFEKENFLQTSTESNCWSKYGYYPATTLKFKARVRIVGVVLIPKFD